MRECGKKYLGENRSLMKDTELERGKGARWKKGTGRRVTCVCRCVRGVMAL
jgi:hypothetical protein